VKYAEMRHTTGNEGVEEKLIAKYINQTIWNNMKGVITTYTEAEQGLMQ